MVTLYLPFDMPRSELVKLGKWFKENVSPETVVDIQYQPELIGGGAFSWKGQIQDYSLRARIEASKKQILNSLLAFEK